MKDKGLLIVMLCVVVIVMSIAFAAFNSALNINGTASIASTWAIGFDEDNSSCEAGGSVSISSSNTAIVGFNLDVPGQEITCTLTVKNTGTLDAKLDSIIATPSGDAPITFTVTPSNDDLATRPVLVKTNGTETITVKATYDDIESQPEDITNTLVVTANYVQNLTQ